MRVYENECVGCPPEMGCLKENCPYISVPRDYCDVCDNREAIYRIDGDDYCEYCAERYVQQEFSILSISEKVKALNEILDIEFSEINN